MKYFYTISVVIILLMACHVQAQSLAGNEFTRSNDEISPLKKLEFYPNPSKGSFKISVYDTDIKEIALTIYDLNGSVVFNKVFTGLFPGVSFDMKLKTPGLYLVKINTGKESIIEKLIVKP